MRYLFSGLMRDTGQPVEGHIESVDVDTAYDMLSGHGVVASSVIPDPKPLNLHEELPDAPELADALESALDSSSAQVDFDNLINQYQGKKVWVIDRDKIRRRVAQVVDTAFHLSQSTGESHEQTQQRIRTALHGLFSDNRNLASERNANSVMGMKYNSPETASRRPVQPSGSLRLQPTGEMPMPSEIDGNGEVALPQATSAALDDQIARLTNVVSQAEGVLQTLKMAVRNIGSGGGGGGSGVRHRRGSRPAANNERNEVLLTIYKSNVELLKAFKEEQQRTAG